MPLHLLRFDLLARCLPAQCPLCRRWPVWHGPAGLCADCLARHGRQMPRCARCALALAAPAAAVLAQGEGGEMRGEEAQSRALPWSALVCGACMVRPGPLQHCVAAVDYAYPWQQLIAQFKYYAAPAWAHGFAQLLLRQPGSAALLHGADAIVAVPLAAARLRQRGYNQAWELARALAAQTGQAHKLRRDVVLRHGMQAQQAGMGRQARWRNLRRAFAVQQPGPCLQGQHVLLVDDVMTTGATLWALARVLQRDAGVAAVSAMVFARTPLPAGQGA
ncbi:phosphoribosyltransferase [Vandammella animalimorsus]|uniref:Phosphoribosyltransferase n=2 Tax=Vandammella animalimorsus TaxID=2029117 RepID=A0A2A2T2L9_9BURK|nr:phosphoribosyltransferase [Vandammella animalimorsus]PAX15733.1 phosphoribosyltransferase [Vandammella animalimorsus]PAX19886.1 phosphoribosyltransferase [Vandammella animalimorsus]